MTVKVKKLRLVKKAYVRALVKYAADDSEFAAQLLEKLKNHSLYEVYSQALDKLRNSLPGTGQQAEKADTKTPPPANDHYFRDYGRNWGGWLGVGQALGDKLSWGANSRPTRLELLQHNLMKRLPIPARNLIRTHYDTVTGLAPSILTKTIKNPLEAESVRVQQIKTQAGAAGLPPEVAPLSHVIRARTLGKMLGYGLTGSVLGGLLGQQLD